MYCIKPLFIPDPTDKWGTLIFDLEQTETKRQSSRKALQQTLIPLKGVIKIQSHFLLSSIRYYGSYTRSYAKDPLRL